MSDISLMTQHLSEQVARAWQAFDRAADWSYRVTPAAPILFFGDLDAYRASPLRVVTVGLNPSLHEFPSGLPFRRFPLAEGNRGREPSRYLAAMSAYFRTDPYRGWFNAFEPLLNGLAASFYEGAASTALHTDICSPVATDPTWSRLDKADRAALEADGSPLWHMLLENLRPQIVAISVANDHLKRIEFVPRADWKIIHFFYRKADGTPRKRPYEIRTRWYDVGGERSLFVFGTAALKPFQLLSDRQKRKTGELLLMEKSRWPISVASFSSRIRVASTNLTLMAKSVGTGGAETTSGNSCSFTEIGSTITARHKRVTCAHGASGSRNRTSSANSILRKASRTILATFGGRSGCPGIVTGDCITQIRLSSATASFTRTASSHLTERAA